MLKGDPRFDATIIDMKSIDAADAKWKPHYQDTDTF
jgi:hypothetical protein